MTKIGGGLAAVSFHALNINGENLRKWDRSAVISTGKSWIVPPRRSVGLVRWL